MKDHHDIRIGTLLSASQAPSIIPQILPHGFESFSLTFWQKIDIEDWAHNAAAVKAATGDDAIVSSDGFFN